LPKLLEVYRLYQSGQVQQAEQLYQQVRALVGTNAHSALSEPFSTPESLPLEAQFIWQQVTDADATQPSRRLLQALQLLVNQYPQFIPGYTRLAQALEWNGRPVDGLTVLEQAIARYPDQAEVARARVQALSRASRLSDAATAALEFVMKNPHSPYVSEFKALAETMLQQSQVRERQQQPRNAFLGRLLKGGFNFLFTGGVAGPLGTIQDLLRLLR
jgi:tetratricopeptide (TPR) repeat protein